MIRPRPSFWNELGYRVTRGLIRLGLRLYFRWRIHDLPRLEGPVVLVANHTSFLDPLILGAASPQRVAFLMTSTTYRSGTMGWFYRLNRSIPLEPRGGNREGLRQARAALEQGEVVGIFPEGGISRSGDLLLGNPGAVSLVLQQQVSVVPVGLCGVRDAMPYGQGLPRPRRIEVRFGAPIPAAELMQGADRKERLDQATRRIMQEIGRLTGQPAREDLLGQG